MEVAVALELLLQLLTKAEAIGALIRKARAEGRTDLTEEEVDGLVGKDDVARARLQAVIDSIK